MLVARKFVSYLRHKFCFSTSESHSNPDLCSDSYFLCYRFTDSFSFLNKVRNCMEADTRLPPNNASKSTADRREDGYVSHDVCTICLERISERAITIPCNHCSFDFICLVSWLQEQPKCPLCKTVVTAVEYDWRSPSDFKTFTVCSLSAAPKTTQSSPALSTRPQSRPRRFRRAPASLSRIDEDALICRRRYIYRHNLYSLHIGSNRVSRFRNITPQDVAASPDLQSKARKWIRRELRVFSFLDPTASSTKASCSRGAGNAEFLLEYIVAILRTLELKDSCGRAEDLLAEFLGRDNARLFLHELESWMRSPYEELRDWDRVMQYRRVLPWRSKRPDEASEEPR